MECLTKSLKKSYKTVERGVMKNVWLMGKKKDEKKIKHVKMKRDEVTKRYDEEINREYKVTDKELEEEMMKDVNKEVENYVVYDEIELDEDEKSYLRLGPKFREFDDINDEENEVETEIHCIKARMETRKREEVKDEDGNYDEEERKKLDDEHKMSKRIFENEEKKLSLARQLVTDSKYNTRSFPPRMAEKKVEMKIQVQRDELILGMKRYKKMECIGRRQKEVNLSDQEAKGKKKILVRVKNEEIIIGTTDKSGKFAVMKPEHYLKAAEVHLKDKEIQWNDVPKIEEEMNCHSRQMLRIFRMGSIHNQEDRIRKAYQVKDSRPGEVTFLIKDHKKSKEGSVLPPTRPVCNARDGPNSRLSNIVATVLNVVADNADEEGNECRSTEEMMRAILETNREIANMSPEEAKDIVDLETLSWDVEALYPECKKRESSEIIEKAIKESDVIFSDVNWEEAGRYVAINCTDDEIEQSNLDELVPKRTTNKGRKPKMVYLDTEEAERKGPDGKKVKVPKWENVREPRDENERRLLMAKVMKIAVLVLMGNHVYRFNGKVYNQEDGGSIGLEATQGIARNVMIDWDKMMRKTLKILKIRTLMYKRYVDDINTAVVPKPAGTEYVAGQLVVTEERLALDQDVPTDVRTGRLLREIANEVMKPMIKLVEDVPTNHESNKIPILDLEVWVEKVKVGNKDEDVRPQIKHKFYKKPMASDVTLNAKSAYPEVATRATLTEETLRRLRNNSPEDDLKSKCEHITKWAISLKRGGHVESFRVNMIAKALRRYKQEIKDHEEGRRDIYRSRQERERQIEERGGRDRRDCWFKNKGGRSKQSVTSIFRVPMTKGGKLKDEIEKKLEKYEAPDGVKAKVMENSGRSVKNVLVRNDPFPREHCGREECTMNNGKCREKCYTANANYTIKCKRCDFKLNEIIENIVDVNEDSENMTDVEHEVPEEILETTHYAGETSRSVHFRFLLHLAMYRNKKNHMWEHVKDKHGSVVGDSKGREDFEVVLTAKDKCVQRRVVRESVKIRRILTGEDRKELNENRREEYEDKMKKQGGGQRREVRENENAEKRKKKIEELNMRARVMLLNDHFEWFTPKLVGVSLTQL
jgi:hypothetical protein